MDGLIPFVIKALKKKKATRHYYSLSSSSGRAFDGAADRPPKGCLFLTPQHPKAPRWHDGEEYVFVTPQEPRASSRWLHGGDGGGEPAVAGAPLRRRAKSHNRQHLGAMATPTLRH